MKYDPALHLYLQRELQRIELAEPLVSDYDRERLPGIRLMLEKQNGLAASLRPTAA
jgi:hypothetical protein